jgi:uncharacterized protein (DUF433 family)
MGEALGIERVYAELGAIRQELSAVKAQLAQAIRPESLHIVRDLNMHRGEPTIRGTAITVRTIVERTRLGDTPEEIVAAYPGLTLARVHAALGYYYDHPGEIDGYIRENREALWQTSPSASS